MPRELKDNNTSYNLKWANSSHCEKLCILPTHVASLLNKRSENVVMKLSWSLRITESAVPTIVNLNFEF